MQSATEIRYASESKFNRYAQLVERNLQSFDTVSEWADVISFLGKLLKVGYCSCACTCVHVYMLIQVYTRHFNRLNSRLYRTNL
jgi:hypothetical protein